MAKSKKLKKRKGGRHVTTGIGVPIVVRMHQQMLGDLDEWIWTSGLSRPEAVRQLISWALTRARELRETREQQENQNARTSF